MMDIHSIYSYQQPLGRKIPSMGYEITSKDVNLLQKAYSSGCRHMIFDTRDADIVIEWCRGKAIPVHDIFFTAKACINTDRHQGAQAVTLKLIEKLGLTKVDMICLYNSEPVNRTYSSWLSKWLELESLLMREMTSHIGVATTDVETVRHLCTKCRTTSPQIALYPVQWLEFRHQEGLNLTPFKDLHKTFPFHIGVTIDFTGSDELSIETSLETLKTSLRVLMASKLVYTISSQSPTAIKACFEILDFKIPPETFRKIKSNLQL